MHAHSCAWGPPTWCALPPPIRQRLEPRGTYSGANNPNRSGVKTRRFGSWLASGSRHLGNIPYRIAVAVSRGPRTHEASGHKILNGAIRVVRSSDTMLIDSIARVG